eukprot:403364170
MSFASTLKQQQQLQRNNPNRRQTPLQLSQTGTAPITHRGTSQSKYEQNLGSNSNQGINKSQEFKKGFTKHLTGSMSTQNLETQYTMSEDAQSMLTPQIQNQSQNNGKQLDIMNQKLSKVFDRIGYLEDALSRVELQQDSIRPVIKALEQSQSTGLNHQKLGSSVANIRKQGAVNKENANNIGGGSVTSSFVSQANNLLLEKLTKTTNNQQKNQTDANQQHILQTQCANMGSISQDSSLILMSKENPLMTMTMGGGVYSRDEIEKMIAVQLESHKQELQQQYGYQQESRLTLENVENILNSIDVMRQDLIRVEENQRNYSYSQSGNNTTNVIKLNSSNPSPNNSQIVQTELASFKAQFSDQLHFFKSKLDVLLQKVDSMDNSYDKRISNLEAVVTPLISQERGLPANQILDLISNELSNLQTGPQINMIIDEKVKLQFLSQELLMKNLENEILSLKQLGGQYKINEGGITNKSLTNSQITNISLHNNPMESKIDKQTINMKTMNSQLSSSNLAKFQSTEKENNIQKSSNFNTQSSLSSQTSIQNKQITKDTKSQNSNGYDIVQTHSVKVANQVKSTDAGHSSVTSNRDQKANLMKEFKQLVQTNIKKVSKSNNELKDHLESLESHILTTSESINDRLEDIHRQMGDLHSEIHANIDLVREKKRLNAPDTNQFVSILGEDVKQFISCMREEIESVLLSINERDDTCKLDMQRIESKINQGEQCKQQLLNHQAFKESSSQSSKGKIQSPNRSNKPAGLTQSNTTISQDDLSTYLSVAEIKELQKIDAFREHTLALQRHMDNTSTYLQKQVVSVDSKIDSAKQILFKELGITLKEDANKRPNSALEKEIREVVEEEYDEDEDEEEQTVQDYANSKQEREEEFEENDDVMDLPADMDEESQSIDEISIMAKQNMLEQQQQQFLYQQQQQQYNSNESDEQNYLNQAQSNTLKQTVRQQSHQNTNSHQPFYYQSQQQQQNMQNQANKHNLVQVYDSTHSNQQHYMSQYDTDNHNQYANDDQDDLLNNDIDDVNDDDDELYDSNGSISGSQQKLYLLNNNDNSNTNGSTVIDESEPHRAQKSPTHNQQMSLHHKQFSSNNSIGSANSSGMVRSSSKSGLQQPTKRLQGRF